MIFDFITEYCFCCCCKNSNQGTTYSIVTYWYLLTYKVHLLISHHKNIFGTFTWQLQTNDKWLCFVWEVLNTDYVVKKIIVYKSTKMGKIAGICVKKHHTSIHKHSPVVCCFSCQWLYINMAYILEWVQIIKYIKKYTFVLWM